MKKHIDNFRVFWQKPRKAGVNQHDRQVTFLELFYDLVYVAIIGELTHALAYNMNGQGITHFIFLFTIVWWAWFNGTIYHDLHSNNDMRTRIFTFLQMLAIVPMAIFAHHAIGEDGVKFAMSYATFEFILSIMWWRAGAHDKKHRLIAYPFAIVFLIDTILFFASAFVPETWRYYFWFFGLIIAFMLPIYLYLLTQRNAMAKRQVSFMTKVSASLVERYGLFIIIVLGEVIIGVVHSTANKTHEVSILIPVAIGTLIAIGLWRVYFDFISHRKPRCTVKHFAVWYYLHLPLTIGVSIMGATMLHIVKYVNEPLPSAMQIIYSLGTATFMLCSALLIPIIVQNDHSQRYYKTAYKVLIFSTVAQVAFGFLPLTTIQLLLATVALLALPFIFTSYVWWLEINASTFPIDPQVNLKNKKPFLKLDNRQIDNRR